MKHIEKAWQQYARVVFQGKDEQEISFHRRVFFAGAYAVFTLLVDTTEELTQEKAEEVFDQVADEFNEHVKASREEVRKIRQASKPAVVNTAKVGKA